MIQPIQTYLLRVVADRVKKQERRKRDRPLKQVHRSAQGATVAQMQLCVLEGDTKVHDSISSPTPQSSEHVPVCATQLLCHSRIREMHLLIDE